MLSKYTIDELNKFYFSHEKDHLNALGNKAWAEIQYPYVEYYVKKGGNRLN